LSFKLKLTADSLMQLYTHIKSHPFLLILCIYCPFISSIYIVYNFQGDYLLCNEYNVEHISRYKLELNIIGASKVSFGLRMYF